MKIQLYEHFLDLIFPKTCGYCEKITLNNGYICNECREKYIYEFQNKCKLCGKTTYNIYDICNECIGKRIYYSSLRYVTFYEDIMKQRITEYKFFEKKYLSHFFAEIILNNVEKFEADLLIPVPIGKKRKLERGYNQSDLIAKELAQKWDIKFEPNVLKKVKETPKQSKLTARERQKNIKNAFEVIDLDRVKGKKVILFDDIFTTGATVNEISRLLIKCGANAVNIIVIARGHG